MLEKLKEQEKKMLESFVENRSEQKCLIPYKYHNMTLTEIVSINFTI